MPPLRPLPGPVAKALKKVSQRPDRMMMDALLGRPGLTDAVESFAMGATGPMNIGKRGIEAWHGSPFRFDRFDPAHIGSGEGAQAFGRGFYAASERPVAEGYRRTLPIKHMNRAARESYDWTDDPSDAMDALKAHPGMASGDYQTFLRELEKNDLLGFDYPHQAFRFADHTNTFPDITPELVKARRELGALYKLRIDVAPEDLASLDAPVGEQPERVRSALSELMERLGMSTPHEATSEPLGKILKKARGANGDVEGALSSRGVQGFRYLDGTSRKAGEGTENLVVFDPSRIKIIERLAAAGLSAESIRNIMGMKQQRPAERRRGGW